jgi:hypothetical protein
MGFDWYQAALASAFGLIGRLMYLADERRRAISLGLVWEIPTAVGMGIAGFGLSELLNVKWGWVQVTIAICCGYMGPRWISVGAAIFVRKVFKIEPPPP